MSNFLFSLWGPIRRVFFGSWQTQNAISVLLFLFKVNFIEICFCASAEILIFSWRFSDFPLAAFCSGEFLEFLGFLGIPRILLAPPPTHPPRGCTGEGQGKGFPCDYDNNVNFDEGKRSTQISRSLPLTKGKGEKVDVNFAVVVVDEKKHPSHTPTGSADLMLP